VEESAGGLVHISPPEAARVVVGLGAHHARGTPPPGGAEEPVVGHAELGAGGGQLADAVLAEPVFGLRSQVRQRWRDYFSQLAERAGDERDPRALGSVLGDRRPGADRLV